MLHLLSEWQLPILPDSLSIRFSVNFPFSYSQMQPLQFPQYTECRLSLAFWRISLEFSAFYSPVPPAVLSPVPVSLILFSLLLFSPNHLPIRRKNECLLLLFLFLKLLLFPGLSGSGHSFVKAFLVLHTFPADSGIDLSD